MTGAEVTAVVSSAKISVAIVRALVSATIVTIPATAIGYALSIAVAVTAAYEFADNFVKRVLGVIYGSNAVSALSAHFGKDWNPVFNLFIQPFNAVANIIE